MKNQKTIVSVIIGVLLFSLVGYNILKVYKPDLLDFNDKTESIITSDITPEQSELIEKSLSESNLSFNDRIDIKLNKVQSGKYLGVVEVGATGFNSFVIRVDKNKNWELVRKEFGKSFAIEGFATTEDILKGLREYISTIFNTGVNGKNIHFVISSGALKNENTKKIANSIRQLGYVVNEVTAEQEGKYAALALLNENYKDDSFVVDIGSGNTKISWYDRNNKLQSIETYGAKYTQNGIDDVTVYNEIKELVSKNIPKNRLNQAFIIGGVPFLLANKNKVDSRFQLLRDTYDLKDEEIREKAGLNIYQAIKDGTNTKDFIFDWDANFTIGFLLTMKY